MNELSRVNDSNNGRNLAEEKAVIDSVVLRSLLISILVIGLLSASGSGITYSAFSDEHTESAEWTAVDTFPDNTDAPIANAGGPYEVYEGDSIGLDGTDSSDNVESYAWEFEEETLGSFSDTTANSPTYTAPDDVEGDVDILINLTVTSSGESDTDITTISVRNVGSGNQAPVARFTASRKGNSNNVDLDASSSSDPDGDSLNYEWDINGDGTFTEEGQTIKQQIESGTEVTLRVSDGEHTDTVTKGV